MQVQEKSIKYMVALCVLMLFLSSFFLYCKNKECHKLKQYISVQEANNITLHDVLSRNLKATIYSDEAQLDRNTYLYKISQGKKDSIPLFELMSHIILFVPKQSCNVCYDEVYDALIYAEDTLNYDIITITEKEKYNEVRNIIRDLGFQLDVYYLNDTLFWTSLSIEYAPFFGRINQSFKCCHCFVPIVNYPQYSYLYLKNITEKYREYAN